MQVLQFTDWLGRLPSGDPADPRPFLLPGVRVRFAPIGRLAVRAARAAIVPLYADGAEPDPAAVWDAMAAEYIRRGIVEWEGVGDATGPRDVTPETVEAFLANAHAFEEADAVYATPWADQELEKNAWSVPSNGTSAETMRASDTVPIAQEAGDAGNAPTVSASRKPKRGHSPGK